MATKKPNILYIMADQMAAPLLAFHDKNSPIKTPNLDRLSEEGVTFDSAYCNSPLCAPSRFVMVTGQLPSKIGAYDNAADLPADTPTYAHYLRREGYHTALAGKMHFCGPDQLHGYEQRLTSDIYPGDYGWSVNWDEPVCYQNLECKKKKKRLVLTVAENPPRLVPQHVLRYGGGSCRSHQPARFRRGGDLQIPAISV